MKPEKEKLTDTRLKFYEIIFESDTPAGKAFDVGLLICIVLSVTVVLLESVPAIKIKWGEEFYILEWIFTLIFTVEYLSRLWVVLSKKKLNVLILC